MGTLLAESAQKEDFSPMNHLRKLRPTPSMVIACAALTVALAGTRRDLFLREIAGELADLLLLR